VKSTIKQSKGIDLPFEGLSEEWAMYLLGLPLSRWAWRVTWGPDTEVNINISTEMELV
jgi:hypothetical protein